MSPTPPIPSPENRLPISLSTSDPAHPTLTVDWRGGFILNSLIYAVTSIPHEELPPILHESITASLHYASLPASFTSITPSHLDSTPSRLASGLGPLALFLSQIQTLLTPLASQLIKLPESSSPSPSPKEEPTPTPRADVQALLDVLKGLHELNTPPVVRGRFTDKLYPAAEHEYLPLTGGPSLTLNDREPHLSTVTIPTYQFAALTVLLDTLHDHKEILVSHPSLRAALAVVCDALNNDVSTWPPTPLPMNPDHIESMRADLSPHVPKEHVEAIDARRFVELIHACVAITAPFAPHFDTLVDAHQNPHDQDPQDPSDPS